jgi:hypothetical protein
VGRFYVRVGNGSWSGGGLCESIRRERIDVERSGEMEVSSSLTSADQESEVPRFRTTRWKNPKHPKQKQDGQNGKNKNNNQLP